jgi:PGF-CTERM protein
MTIHVLAADNVGIRGDPEIVVKRAGQAVPATLVHDEGDLYHAELVAQAGTYDITVRASDARHTGIGYGEVTVRHVLTTYPATLTTPSDAVAVTASDVGYCPAQHAQQQKACIVAMYLMGDGINVTMGFDETLEHWTWKATRNNAGFHEGVNNVTAHAVYVDHFLGSRRIAGGEAVSSPFQVTINGTVGSIVFTDKNGGPRTQPSAAERTTPGFEMVAAVVALVAVGAVIRRRRAA